MDKIRKIYRFFKGLWVKTSKLKYMYAWYYKHSSIKNKQVLFESFHGKDISDSSLAILREFLKTKGSGEFTIYFATNDKKRDCSVIEKLGLPVKLVDISTFEYVKVLAVSKYLINNSSFPAYFIRRPEQIYLQTWHGTPLKTLGKNMRFGIESMYNVQHNFLHANYIMFPNEFTKEVIMRDYNLENLYTGKVIMNGYPRNSIFLDSEKAEQVKEQLGNDKYTTMAYMPTWRGKSNHDVSTKGYNRQVNELLAHLDMNLKEHQKLYVNFHPIVQKDIKLGNYKHIFPFPQGVDKYEFLNSVDVLITDYSSVFFDYSITRKPIILYMYDYNDYMHDRGMYFDIKELPFRKIYDRETLIHCLVNEEFREDHYENDREYIEKYIQYDSIDAGKNMVDLVFHHRLGNMPVTDYAQNKKKKRHAVLAPNIKTPQALEGLAKTVCKEKEIVIFEKRFFTPELSSFLYDHYRDSFDYIFITRTLPRTVLEEIRSKKNKSIQNVLQNREVKRCFSELNVSPKFRSDYYHGMSGEKFHLSKIGSIAAKVRVDKGILYADFSESKISSVTKILVTTEKDEILWTRSFTQNECKGKYFAENFCTLLQDPAVQLNQKYYILVEGVDDKGRRKPYYVIDKALYHKQKQQIDDLDKMAFYFGENLKSNVINDRENELQENIIAPVMEEERGYVQLFIGTDEQLVGKNMRGQVLKLKIKKSVVHIKMRFKKQKSPIEGVVLSYRSKIESIEYPFDYTVSGDNEYWVIDASIDMSEIKLEELFWDVFVLTKKNGCDVRLSAYWTKRQRFMLMLCGYQCKATKDHIIFPYFTLGGKIAFTYRQKSKYDGIGTKIKEFIALGLYTVLLPYWKKKRLWLVFEKFCSMAQDNGYYFFKYCMENLKENSNHIYYVLDKNSVDWKKMKKYGSHVIPFMSIKHMLYCMVANLYVGSDSKKHLYAWRAKPNLISNRIAKHNILFLQHGVTALKRVDHIFGKKGTSAMNHFTTTSRFEQEIVVKYFGYKAGDAPILGFTRWDVLEDTSKEDERIILAMPTWRSWLEEKSAEEFKKSDYYHNYMRLLQSEKLAAMLKENDVTLIFYIHPKFKDYLSEFNVSGENIQLIPFGSEPLNEIMKKCSMLITDYSSVCWDVCYLDKPVLFYQFDYEMYMQAHGSYLDMEHELFGDRYVDYEKLIDGIEEYIRNGFREKEEYRDMKDYYFEYRDNDNSKRTYEYIIGRGY